MNRWVEISFDCIPLRSIGRLDVPLDASPKYQARCERIKAAIAKHGSHNSYYLENARCKFRLVNCENTGTLEYRFEGTVLTCAGDKQCQQCDLVVELASETCPWLTQPVSEWFAETVSHAVAAEFDRYIQAGGVSEQTSARQANLDSEIDESGGFVGMYL